MARKISYEDTVIVKLVGYLEARMVHSIKNPQAILIKATAETHDKVFRDIVTILAASKYGLQEDIKTLEIEVFNSSI